MSQPTQRYKRTLKGSIGSGMQSLMGSGRRFYILEHKVSSKYHKAGENQQIIVDQIEIGRDSTCQVRFDESFATVSRRHAAIVRDGDNWKLVQLSQTNSTFLNGQRVQKEWYLQNGDEIQLSVNGPKMGFITLAGKKGTVGSLGLTRRLTLFRQQALRPYKYAIAALSCLLVLSIGGLGTWSYLKSEQYEGLIADAQARLETLKGKNSELEKMIADAAVEQARLDSLLKIKSRPINKTVIVKSDDGNGSTSKLQVYEDDVFYISAMVFAVYNGKVYELETSSGGGIAWSGTGFLLSDGRFVTAKHCVEGWKFDSTESLAQQLKSLKDEETRTLFLAGLTESNGVKLRTYMIAKSPTKELRLTSDNFKFSRSDEGRVSIGDGLSIIRATGDGGTDWAYVHTGKTGSIQADVPLSSTLPAGARLEVLGYPRGMKAAGGSCLYGSCQTSGRGLNEGIIVITGKNYEHGNSGGPVFYNDNGTYKAIGIVSFSVYDNMGGITPLYNLR